MAIRWSSPLSPQALFARWTADQDDDASPPAASNSGVDVIALFLGADGLVRGDDDLVFYNHPSTYDGAVDLTVGGPSEQTVTSTVDALDADITRVLIAATLANGRTFGDVGPIDLTLGTPTGVTVARAVLDTATVERTLLLAEIYRRGDRWHLRPIGQGYEDDLRARVERHGVDVSD